MPLVPINLAGGEYRHKSRPLTNQQSRNFWPQVQGTQKARSPYILQSFYGLKEWASPGVGGVNRGAVVNQGILYRVVGTMLYKVASDTTHTALGTIVGSNRCILDALGSQVTLTNGSGFAYYYDGTSLNQVTDVNLGNPNGVAVINNQAIYDNGVGQGFVVTDVGDPGTIDGLNNAQAESDSDNLIVPYTYRETLYLFGEKTIELWYNSGQGNPPFDKIQGAIINTGLGAKYSVADNPDFIFFFGSDKQFHTLTGGVSSVEQPISTPAMVKEIEGYQVTSDCVGYTMELEGQRFYVATFPTEDVSWVFPVGGEWFKWGSSLAGRIRADSYVEVFGKKLVMDYASDKIYELDAETYTDAGENIVRTRVSAPIHAGLVNQRGKEFEITELQFFLEVGVGNISAPGDNPKLMVSTSRDGGRTFGTERFIRVGKAGEIVKVRSRNWGRFKDSCVIRIRTSDPVYWAIYDAKADMDICI